MHRCSECPWRERVLEQREPPLGGFASEQQNCPSGRSRSTCRSSRPRLYLLIILRPEGPSVQARDYPTQSYSFLGGVEAMALELHYPEPNAVTEGELP
jgi:hypothetical protein